MCSKKICLVIINLDFLVLSLVYFCIDFERFKTEHAFQMLEEGLIFCPATYLISPNVPNICCSSRSDSSVLRN